MRIMVRNAEDDFRAMNMANAMEGVGATVFAITYMGERTFDGALMPHPYFSVWAKVDRDEQIAAVDIAIEKEMP